VTDLFSEHPAARLLEAYALEDLPDADLSAVEEHLLVCERCRQIVSELDVFAPTLRGWGRKRTSAAFVHETDDGPIHLELRALPDAKWAARFWGDALEGSAVFGSVREAYAHLRSVFSEMYPDHLCNPGCGAPD
jgi:hypothetical protein